MTFTETAKRAINTLPKKKLKKKINEVHFFFLLLQFLYLRFEATISFFFFVIVSSIHFVRRFFVNNIFLSFFASFIFHSLYSLSSVTFFKQISFLHSLTLIPSNFSTTLTTILRCYCGYCICRFTFALHFFFSVQVKARKKGNIMMLPKKAVGILTFPFT